MFLNYIPAINKKNEQLFKNRHKIEECNLITGVKADDFEVYKDQEYEE